MDSQESPPSYNTLESSSPINNAHFFQQPHDNLLVNDSEDFRNSSSSYSLSYNENDARSPLLFRRIASNTADSAEDIDKNPNPEIYRANDPTKKKADETVYVTGIEGRNPITIIIIGAVRN